MEQQAAIIDSDPLEQIRLESVALRRELGLPGGRLTEEQQKIYLEAKQKQWYARKRESGEVEQTSKNK